jgi:hypothetical protein
MMGRHKLKCAAVGLAASALFTFAGPLVASAHADTSPMPVPVEQGLGSQDGKVTFTLYVLPGVKVNVIRKWDSFNNCVSEDGTEYRDYRPAGTNIGGKGYGVLHMSVTIKSGGACGAERSRMHWDVSFPGYKSGSADVSIGQLMAGAGFFPGCEGTSGSVACGFIKTPPFNYIDPYVH